MGMLPFANELPSPFMSIQTSTTTSTTPGEISTAMASNENPPVTLSKQLQAKPKAVTDLISINFSLLSLELF